MRYSIWNSGTICVPLRYHISQLCQKRGQNLISVHDWPLFHWQKKNRKCHPIIHITFCSTIVLFHLTTLFLPSLPLLFLHSHSFPLLALQDSNVPVFSQAIMWTMSVYMVYIEDRVLNGYYIHRILFVDLIWIRINSQSQSSSLNSLMDCWFMF